MNAGFCFSGSSMQTGGEKNGWFIVMKTDTKVSKRSQRSHKFQAVKTILQRLKV